jgi:hypothetical protein
MSATDAPAPDRHVCLNCEASTHGLYCHHCGQRADAERFTVKNLWKQNPNAVPQADHGLLRTLRDLLVRPGSMINGYLDGRRVPYVNPFALLSLLAGISAFAYSSWPFELVVATDGMPAERAARFAAFSRHSFEFYSPSLLLYLPLTAGLTVACFAGVGRGYAEHLVLNAYLMAGSTLLMLVLFPALVATSGGPAFAQTWRYGVLALLGYQCVALYRVFAAISSKRWSIALRTMIAMALYLVMLTVIPAAFFELVYVRL